MTDGELEHRYEALCRAVTAVLDLAAAGTAPVSRAHREKLDALEQALNGSVARPAVPREVVDPDRHLLSTRDYRSGVPGGAPYSLADEARSIRRGMAADDAAGHRTGDWPDDWHPTLTAPQAVVVATLLQELAARLAATRDPGGEELAAVARELADEVLPPTSAGPRR